MTLISSLPFSVSSPYPIFFFLREMMISVLCARSNLMQSHSASWDDVMKLSGILKHVINLLLLKIICCFYNPTNTHSPFQIHTLHSTFNSCPNISMHSFSSHSAHSLWDHSSTGFPQPGMTRGEVVLQIQSPLISTRYVQEVWGVFVPTPASTTWLILANAGLQWQVWVGLQWSHSVLDWDCTLSFLMSHILKVLFRLGPLLSLCNSNSLFHHG